MAKKETTGVEPECLGTKNAKDVKKDWQA